MKETNTLLLLTPKKDVACIEDNMSIRQALEKMNAHHFTAVPVINHKNGQYISSVSEGDFLRHILSHQDLSVMRDLEEDNILKIVRKDYMPACKVDTSFDELVASITANNYVPIVDDRNILMGIVTRKAVINYLKNK